MCPTSSGSSSENARQGPRTHVLGPWRVRASLPESLNWWSPDRGWLLRFGCHVRHPSARHPSMTQPGSCPDGRTPNSAVRGACPSCLRRRSRTRVSPDVGSKDGNVRNPPPETIGRTASFGVRVLMRVLMSSGSRSDASHLVAGVLASLAARMSNALVKLGGRSSPEMPRCSRPERSRTRRRAVHAEGALPAALASQNVRTT